MSTIEFGDSAMVTRVLRHRTTFPEWGQWRFEGILEGGELPSGMVTLNLAGLECVGTVLRAGYDAPDRPHVVVVGGLGWSSPVALPAANLLTMFADPGVRLSSILRAVASAAGEPILQPTDQTTATHWEAVSSRVGEAVVYSDVLTAMVREGVIPGWYVGADGTTRFAARPSVTVAGRATQMAANASVGLRVFGVDDPSEFMPGATVGGFAIGRMTIAETPEQLKVECWDQEAPSVAASVKRMVAKAFPALVYGYPRTYIVAASNADGTYDLEPPPVATSYLREMRSVEQWSAGGASVNPRLGAVVTVLFRDADPRAPVVVGFAPDTPVDVVLNCSATMTLGEDADAVDIAGGDLPVARETDPVQAGRLLQDGPLVYYRETLVAPWVALPIPAVPGAPAPSDAGVQLVGDITGGSSKVSAG